MSLINDALRRARQAQKPPSPSHPAAAGPAVRAPIAPRHEPRMTWLPAFCLAAMGITALVVAANWRAHHPSEPLAAHARTLDAAPSVHLAAPRPEEAPQARTTTVMAVSLGDVSGQPRPAAPEIPHSVAGTRPAEETVPVPASEMPSASPAPMPPPPPKLQGIIYHPHRPSAMIDGKVLFVGDKLREYRVLAITPTGATLVSASATNHLDL